MIEQELAQRSIILDSSLSVLLCVALAGERHIAEHKRLGSFNIADFHMLRDILESAAAIVISPNVATETSNLVRQSKDSLQLRFASALKELLDRSQELYVESKRAASIAVFPRLGLADSVSLLLAGSWPDAVLLTSDGGLFLAAAHGGLNACNFNHVRNQRPDFG